MVSHISILPAPVHLTAGEGQFTLTPQTSLVIKAPADVRAAVVEAAETFLASVRPATGFELPFSNGVTDSTILLDLNPALSGLGTEGYRLNVCPTMVWASAARPAGLFYALQSLRQLFPAAIYSSEPVSGVAWTAPAVEIEDFPRFGWRGMMLDTCRHFMPKEFILKLLDLLALHKMNSFHWHLSDDQGWRIEIKKYPRLTEVGGWRSGSLVGPWSEVKNHPTYDRVPHGGFYTQDEVREVVEYARKRFINVLPEIEMPGHAQAAIAAYPELGNTGTPIEVCQHWGVIEDVYNVEESTLHFMQDVLDEVMGLFPSPFIHVGGDECPKAQWKNSPAAQARMKELGLKNEEELQSYFIRRMDEYLTARGRRLVGWDEILEGGLAPNATVMSWRGEAGGIAAANAGHDVVMSPTHSTYFDYCQAADHSREPLSIGGHLPLAKVYAFEPVSAAIDAEQAKHVLGSQCQLWTEYVPNSRHAEYMIFPRLCALAEVIWSPAENKNFDRFTQDLRIHYDRLDALQVNYRVPRDDD